MSYVDSVNISVFPSALRVEDGGGKFTSESNLTGIVRTITGKESFYRKTDDNDYIVVIHGYCFKISDPTIVGKYLNIKLDSSSRLVSQSGSTALDSNSKFTGLWVSDTADSSATYSLYIGSPNELYLDANTIFNLDNVTVGAASKLTSTVGDSNRSIYLSSGVPTAGKGIFVTSSSASEPSGSQNGDIWLKY